MPLCPGDEVMNIVNRMQDSGYSTCVEVIANPGGDMSATKCACVLLMDPTSGDYDLDVLSTCIYHESHDVSAFDLWILCNDTYGLNFTCKLHEIRFFQSDMPRQMCRKVLISNRGHIDPFCKVLFLVRHCTIAPHNLYKEKIP